MIDFNTQIYYIKNVKVIGFFLLIILFSKAASSGNWINPIALTRSEPPFYSREIDIMRKGSHYTDITKHPRGMLGKKHTPETKKKMSRAHKGKKLSAETRKKISEKLNSENNHFWNGGKIKRNCQQCGKIFWTKKSRIENGWGIFCSHKCQYLSPEIREKQSKAICQRMISGKHKYKNTDIEMIMNEILNKINILFIPQFYIKAIKGVADFFLPEYNIIIECDGDYWHNKEGRAQRDINRDLIASFNGYKTLRFRGTDIKNKPQNCLIKIKQIIKKEKSYADKLVE